MQQASEALGPQGSDSYVAALCPLRRVLARASVGPDLTLLLKS